MFEFILNRILGPFASGQPGIESTVPMECAELEPRVLYSAAPFPVEHADALVQLEHLQHELAELDLIQLDVSPHESFLQSEAVENPDLFFASDPTIGPLGLPAVELVFVDPSVEDYQQLIQSAYHNSMADIEVVVLNEASDGILQITEVLRHYDQVSAIHLVTHGSDGELQLGGSRLNSFSLENYGNEISGWASSFAEGADLLIYGCDVAQSETGQAFLAEISELTRLDVAASNDATGHQDLGGDWDFEYQIGDIGTSIVVDSSAQQQWWSTLGTITVTTNLDVVDAGDGLVSLREAIDQANAGSGTDTIVLSSGTYSLDIDGAGEDLNATGDLDLFKSVTIQGAGMGSTIIDVNFASGDRAFDLYSGSTLTIHDLTIQDGDGGGSGGGAIVINSGTATVVDQVRFFNNSSNNGGAIQNDGTLTVTNSIFEFNSGNSGGAIDNSGNMTLNNVAIANNSAGNAGGGIRNNGIATLEQVSLTGNTANAGGAIHHGGGGANMDLTNVTISGNSADTFGGGIYTNRLITATNMTLAFNDASNAGLTGDGGGIFMSGGGGNVDVRNSIVFGNTGDLSNNVNSELTTSGHNIVDSTTVTPGNALPGDQLDVDPLLGPLANHGGLTQTHSITDASPAYNAGTTVSAPSVDQRGILRDGNPDIGAFEYMPVSEAVWISTAGDVTGSGAPGLDAWDKDTLLEISGPGFSLEPGTTNGNLTAAFDLVNNFGADPDVELTGLHVVTKTMTIGGTGTTVSVQEGDVLFSVNGAQPVLTSTNSVTMDKNDVVRFRPDVPGDYTTGTFEKVLDNPLGAINLGGISLVEKNMTIGGLPVVEGGFLLVETKGTDNIIHYFDVTSAGAVTSGSASVIVDGTDIGIGSGEFTSVHLVSESTSLGGANLTEGQILVSVDRNLTGFAGMAGTITNQDVIALTVTSAGTTTTATGTLLMEGADINLDTAAEAIDAFSLTSVLTNSTNTAPTITSDGGGATAAVSTAENTTFVTTVTASDPEAPPQVLAYSIVSSGDGAHFTIDSASGDLSFVSAPDFETPTDSDNDNIYEVSVMVADGVGGFDVQQIYVTVTDDNDAPTLDDSGDLRFAVVPRDEFSHPGNSVAEMLASNRTDPIFDADGDPDGIAVVGFDDTNGSWEYSLNGGSVWNAFSGVLPPVSLTAAVLLDSTARIRFVPNPGYTGPGGTIEFHAWDGSDGSINGTSGIDVTTNGGSTPFSTASETASVEILDPFVANNDSYSTDEDSTLVVDGPGVLINDYVYLHDIVPGALLNYQANLPGVVADTWSDLSNVTGFDLDTTGISYLASTTDATPGITSAFDFELVDGAESPQGFEFLPGDPTTGDATLEFWVRPDNLFGKDVIFDTGGWGSNESGLSLRLEGSQLQFAAYYDDGSVESVVLTTDLGATYFANPEAFMQITLVIEYVDADLDLAVDDLSFELVVNGVSLDTDTLLNAPAFGWSEGETFELGDFDGSAGFVNGGSQAFNGQIGAFRLYDSALTGVQIQQNYDAVATTQVVAPMTVTSTNGISVTLAADGSFTYDPGTTFDYLAVGESLIDSFDYTAQDAAGNIRTATVDITINGVNDDPTISSAIGDTSIDQDQPLSLDVSGSFSDPDISDTLTFSARLAGGSPLPGWLSFDSVSGKFSGTPADGDVGNYTIEVTADDGHGGSLPTDSFVLTVNDVNDAPTVSLTNVVSNLAENTDTASPIKIADIVISDDALGTNHLTLTGADAGNFEIVGTELFLRAGTVLDFETRTSFDLTILVDDVSVGGTPDDSASHTLNINDVNEAPTLALVNTVTNLAENTDTSSPIKMADIVISDDALGTNNLTLSGTDAGDFEIVGTELRLKAGTVLDFEARSSFDVTVNIDDTSVGGTPDDSAAHTLNVNDVNEAPTVSLANTVTNLAENSDTSSPIKMADIVIADDALGTNNLTLTGADAANFEIVGTELRLRAGTVLDFESKTSFDVTVEVDDAAIAGTPEDSANHLLSISDINEAPSISLANVVSNLDENADTTSAIRIADIVITDDALGTNNLTLSGADAVHFEIVGTELRLRAGTPLDFSAKPAYDVTVEVDDSAVGSAPDEVADHTLNINNINDPPAVSLVNVITGIDENSDTSSPIKIADIVIADDGIGVNNLTLSGVDAANFEIVGTELRLRTGTVLDFETRSSFDVTVEVDDTAVGGTPDDLAAHTLNVNDVNEAPTLITNQLVITEGQSVVLTTANVNATDVDNPVPTLNYTVSSVTGGRFALTASPSTTITSFTHAQVDAGEILFIHDGNEAAPSYDVTVSDAGLFDGPHTANIAFTNLNDAPKAGPDAYSTTIESALLGTDLLANDTDADSGSLTTHLASAPSNGSVVVNPDGSFIYTPGVSFTGIDTFTYVVSDGLADSLPAQVVVKVLADSALLPDTPDPVVPDPDLIEPDPVIIDPETSSKAGSLEEEDDDVVPLIIPLRETIPVAKVAWVREKLQIEAVELIQFDTILEGSRIFARADDRGAANDLDTFQSSLLNNDFMDRQGWFWKALDENSEQLQTEASAAEVLLGGTAALASSVTVGYLVWLIKGGQVLAAVMANLPAWRLIDPLPVLNSMIDDEEDDDSLQSIIAEGEDELETDDKKNI